MAKIPTSNIEKAISSGGSNETPLDMNEFIKMADAEKIEADALEDLVRAIEDKFNEQRRPGETIESWLNRTDVEELRRIELSGGGKVYQFSDYKKNKEPKVKEIDLASAFAPNTTLSSLSDSDKETVLKLLQLSGIGKKD